MVLLEPNFRDITALYLLAHCNKSMAFILRDTSAVRRTRRKLEGQNRLNIALNKELYTKHLSQYN